MSRSYATGVPSIRPTLSVVSAVLLAIGLFAFGASPAQAEGSAILLWDHAPPERVCVGDTGFIDVCVTLQERCGGDEKQPLPGREILFFFNPGNCGVDVGQVADDSVLTDAFGNACYRFPIPTEPGRHSIRVKFRGEEKPEPCPLPGNHGCDPMNPSENKRCVQLSAANGCQVIFVDSCCGPPEIHGPADTTVEVCELPTTVCVGPWDVDCCPLPGGGWRHRHEHHGDCENVLGILEPSYGYMHERDLCFDADTAGVYTIVLCTRDQGDDKNGGSEGDCQFHGDFKDCQGVACDTIRVTVDFDRGLICPPDTTVNCDDPTDPEFTGYAVFEACEIEDHEHDCRCARGMRRIELQAALPYAGGSVPVEARAGRAGALDSSPYGVDVETFSGGTFTSASFSGGVAITRIEEVNGFAIITFVVDASRFGQTVLEAESEFQVTLNWQHRHRHRIHTGCGRPDGPPYQYQFGGFVVMGYTDGYRYRCRHHGGHDSLGNIIEIEDTVEFVDQILPGPCAESFTIKRTWYGIMGGVRVDTCTQLIRVVDREPPWFSGVGKDTTVACPAEPHFSEPQVADLCDPDPSLSFVDATSSGDCPGNYRVTRTWTSADNCGNTASASQTVTVVDTTAPVCDVPTADTTFFICRPGDEVCVSVGGHDACAEAVSCRVISGPGQVRGGQWCYAATSSGSFDVRIACADECGNECETSFHVVIDLNDAPVCHVPNDTLIGQCEAAGVRLPVSGTDADGNLLRCEIADGVGKLENGFWVYTPSGDEKQCVTIRCVDVCGVACTAEFCVEFDISEPPVCNLPNDTLIDLCEPVRICLPVTLSATRDLTPVSQCQVTAGPGTILDGEWCYTPPAVDTSFTVTVECSDTCGAGCRGSFAVTIDMNQPPVCEFVTPVSPPPCPSPQVPYVVFFRSTDPDGDKVTCELFGDGILGDGFWQIAPVPGDSVSARIVCRDACGAECELKIDFRFPSPQPPVCILPDDQTRFRCNKLPDSLPVTVTGGAECDIISGPGVLRNGWWVYTPGGDEIVEVAIECVSLCGTCSGSFRITYDINEPPICGVPQGLQEFDLCEPQEICIDLHPSDPDGNLTSCVVFSGKGKIGTDNRWCYYAAADEVIDVVVRCVDACGVECRGTFTVAIDVNEAPVCEFLTPSSPVCTPALAFVPFTTTDPEDDPVTCRLEGPGELTDAGWQYVPAPGEQISVRIICADVCGAECEIGWDMSFPARVPPVCSLPDDTTIALCQGDQVALPVSASGDAVCRITSGPGTLSQGNWVYTPAGPGTVAVSILCVSENGCDSCSGSFSVTFEMMSNPTISFDGGGALTFFLCQSEPVCLSYTAADGLGGDEFEVSVVSGPGTVDAQNDRICFTPTQSGVSVIIAAVEDECGSARDTITVTIDINEPPVCILPDGDTTIVLCEAREVCIPVSATDPDGNLVSCVLTSGVGQIRSGQWCYTPNCTSAALVTITCTDECGATCVNSFTVTFDLEGSPPVCHVPNDTLVVICPPTPITLPVWADDPDGDLIACMVIDGPGELINGYWTYLPPSEGEAVVTVRCTDACGHYCEETFTIVLDLNDPPVLDIPEQTTIEICGPQEICIPISSDDRNKNLAICEVILGPGYISGGSWCYAASGSDEVVTVTIRCTDDCGAVAQRQLRVFIDGSDLPSCELPASGRIILCEPGELCLLIYMGDPYTSGVTCTLLDGDGAIRGNEWCLDVTGPTEATVAIRCTNRCGDQCTATRTYTIEIDPKDCDARTVYAGDLDQSGTLDVMDLTRLARLIYADYGTRPVPTVAGATRRDMPVEADVNCDSMVNEDDLRYLAAYLFEAGPLPCLISGARVPVPPADEGRSPAKDRSGKSKSPGGR